MIKIYSASHHTFIIACGGIPQGRYIRNNLCAAWPGIIATEHEIAILIKYSPSLDIVTFHLDAQRPLKGQHLQVP